MESGIIAQWLIKVGDQVKEGDPLADIETDKATMQMKSYDDGVVAHIDHEAGSEVALGQRVLVLAKKGEDPKQVAASLGAGNGQAAPKSAAPAAKADQAAAEVNHQLGSENGHREEATVAVGGRVKSSPLARKIAAESSVDLSRVEGSGPGGRVIRRDVEAAIQSGGASKSATVGAPRPAAAPLAAQRIPNSRMRKTIAQRMVQAKQAAPEIHVTVDIRVDKLVVIREDLNKKLAPEKIKLSMGDFVTKAVALSLRQHPGVNASFEPDAIVRHGEVNIGIAVALDEGLIVPVLRNADQLGLREIRVQSEAIVSAARTNSLKPEQLSGGTFTISNLGMYGVKQFDAILNMPEVGILAVGAAEKRPVVEGDKLVIGTVMTVTLTADHRAVDGAMAAEFIRTLKGLLEEPAAMLL
jgi:pyruvate dehydrogenase E2 component (dihydrolipoamide acetyltransferase)